MTLEEAIEQCAKELPEGWRIDVRVERGSAWVDLVDPQGFEVEPFGSMDSPDEGLDCAVLEALEGAARWSGGGE